MENATERRSDNEDQREKKLSGQGEEKKELKGESCGVSERGGKGREVRGWSSKRT